MSEEVKWGIIGLGNVAHEFANSFYNTNNAKLIAIASKSQNKLSKFKVNFNTDTIYCHSWRATQQRHKSRWQHWAAQSSWAHKFKFQMGRILDKGNLTCIGMPKQC